MLNFAAAQTHAILILLREKLLLLPQQWFWSVVLTLQFSWWSQHYICTILDNVLNFSLQKKNTYIAKNVMKPKHLLSKTTKIREKFMQNLFSSSVFKNKQKSSCIA